MSQKNDITICLGSSCFSRGNGKTLTIIKKYLEEHNLTEEVFFHGELCTGNCEKGPILKVNGITHDRVTAENIIDILNSYFL